MTRFEVPPRDTVYTVAFVQNGFDYTKLVVDTRGRMQKFEASNLRDQDAKDHVLANWDRAAEMEQSFLPFAINWQAVFRVPEPGKKQACHGLAPRRSP